MEMSNETNHEALFHERITLRGENDGKRIDVGLELAFVRHFYDYKMKIRSIAEFADECGTIWQIDVDTKEVRYCNKENDWFWTEWKAPQES